MLMLILMPMLMLGLSENFDTGAEGGIHLKNGIFWEFFPNGGTPPPLLGTP